MGVKFTVYKDICSVGEGRRGRGVVSSVLGNNKKKCLKQILMILVCDVDNVNVFFSSFLFDKRQSDD